VEQEATRDEVPFAQLVHTLASKALSPSSADVPFKVRFFEKSDTTQTTLSQTSVLNDLTILINTLPATTRNLLPDVEITFTFNQVLFSKARMDHLFDQLQQLICHGAGTAVSTISLLTDKDVQVLPDPKADLHWEVWPGSILDVFRHNTAAHPDKVCIVEDVQDGLTRTFTYQQVFKATCRVANFLLRHGIEREDVVMIYASRGASLAVAILGVLMAGATFSVIDPAYPPARQEIYLSVAQPRGLIVLEQAGTLDAAVRRYISDELYLVCEIPGFALQDDGSATGYG
jgi:L-aminoadipate-semialdehyde dehydrogenase